MKGTNYNGGNEPHGSMKREPGEVNRKRGSRGSGFTLGQHFMTRESREKVTTWPWNAERERDFVESSRMQIDCQLFSPPEGPKRGLPISHLGGMHLNLCLLLTNTLNDDITLWLFTHSVISPSRRSRSKSIS